MKKDLRDILALVRPERAQRVEGPTLEVHTLATVVRVQGSSYRRVGARMLVHASGVIAGSVSGGCLEGEIARKGAWWAAQGPVVMRFAEAETETGTGGGERRRETGDGAREAGGGARRTGSGAQEAVAAAGCGGVIDVLVENVCATDDGGPLAALAWIAERRQAARMVTVIGGPLIGARHVSTEGAMWSGSRDLGPAWPGGHGAIAWDGARDGTDAVIAPDDVLVEDIDAPRELLVAGRHHDIAPVVRMARLLGWEVTNASRGVTKRALGDPDHVIEPTAESVAAWAAARPGAAIVLMTHDLALDRRLLAAIVHPASILPSCRLPAAAPSYLGVLGPAHRTARIVDGLDAPPRALAAIRTPVGLDLGGDGPEAIALSIVSDIQATWHERGGGRLCAPGTGPWAQRPRLVSAS